MSNQGARQDQRAFILMLQLGLVLVLMFTAGLLAGVIYAPKIITLFSTLLNQ
jgi:hypothetical protein